MAKVGDRGLDAERGTPTNPPEPSSAEPISSTDSSPTIPRTQPSHTSPHAIRAAQQRLSVNTNNITSKTGAKESDSATTISSTVTSAFSASTNSPDPHDFYRLQPVAFTPSPLNRKPVASGIRKPVNGVAQTEKRARATNGSQSNASNSNAIQNLKQRATGLTKSREALHSATSQSPQDSTIRSSPALLATVGTRKSSVKDLLNRFEHQDEGKSSSSPSKSPASSRRTVTKVPSRGTLRTPDPAASANAVRPTRDRPNTPTKTLKMTTGAATNADEQWRIVSPATVAPDTIPAEPVIVEPSPPQRRPSKPQRPKIDRSRSASTVDKLSPQSQTSLAMLHTASGAPAERPLFGEIISAVQAPQLPPGMRLPPINTRMRRGSEGVLPSPASIGGHTRTRSNLDVSPSSPTAWYMGLTTSLEGVNADQTPTTSTFITSPFSIDMPAPLRLNPSRSASSSRVPQLTQSPILDATPPSPTARSQLPRPNGRYRGDSNASDRTGSTPNSRPGTRPSSRQGTSGRGGKRSSIPRPVEPQSPTQPPRSERTLYERTKHGPPNLAPIRTTPGQSLRAFITEQPPKLSPPLRSTRQRPHVATASTASSRGRVSETLRQMESDKMRKEKRKSRRERIPELGNIDFAAKQRQIMEALRNGDATQRSASHSNIGRRPRSGTLDSQASDTEMERAIKSDNDVSQLDQSIGSLGGFEVAKHSPPVDEEQTPTRAESRADPTITITGPTPVQKKPSTSRLSREPSPSPAIPGAFVATPPMEAAPIEPKSQPRPLITDMKPKMPISPPGTTPLSALVPASPYDIAILDVDDDSSEEEEDEDEIEPNSALPKPINPWTSPLPGLSQEEARNQRLARSRNVLSQILSFRGSGPPDTPQIVGSQYEDDTQSIDEFTEHGSIQIMLGTSPTSERFSGPRSEGFMWNEDEGDYSVNEQRDADEDKTPVDRSKPLPRLPVSRNQSVLRSGMRSKAASLHSTTSSDRYSKASSYHPLDEEAYRRISGVLREYYRQSHHITPDIVNEVQLLISTHTPDLARQGQWDPTKVTQLYMQELAKGSYGAPVPELPEDLPQMPPLDLYHAYKGGNSQMSRTGSSTVGEDGRLTTPASKVGVKDRDSPRPTLTGPEDFLDASPSIYYTDYPHRLSTTSSEAGTPIEERERPVLPADSGVSLSVDAARRIDKPSPALSSSTGSSSDRRSRLSLTPTLPQIDVDSEGLGIDIIPDGANVDGAADRSDLSRAATREGSIDSSVADAAASTPAPTPNPRTSSKNVYTWYRTPSSRSIAQSVGQSQTVKTERPISVASSQFQRPSTAATTDEGPSTERESLDVVTDLVSLDPIDSATKARLDDRRKGLMELVNTEKSYLRDMSVVDQIYRETGKGIPKFTADDAKVVFGNLDDMIAFSQRFLDSLKESIKSVYTIPKSIMGNSRNSIAGQLSGNFPGERSSALFGGDLNEMERDEKTNVGDVFVKHLQELEKVYGEYAKGLAAAQHRVVAISKDESIENWLRECAEAANNLTKAWNLDALLVKPVQRLLKYSLLLDRVMKATPESHPDHKSLQTASVRMLQTSERINELLAATKPTAPASKKRDRGTSDVRTGMRTIFSRNADKLRQPPVFPVKQEDPVYNNLASKFGEHLVRIQLVMRDIDNYLVDVQNYFDRWIELARALEGLLDAGSSTNAALESKWRKFGIIMRELGNQALPEHKMNVNNKVLDPIRRLLKLHDNPQLQMAKRDKRALDHAKFIAFKERGDKYDRKLQDQAKQYTVLNLSLKSELPKLFKLTATFISACLQRFVQVQMQWQDIWQVKVKQVLDKEQMPRGIDEILSDFNTDFKWRESQAASLSIANGTLTAERMPSQTLSPSTSSLADDLTLRKTTTVDSSVSDRDRVLSFTSSGSRIALPLPASTPLSIPMVTTPGEVSLGISRGNGVSSNGSYFPTQPSSSSQQARSYDPMAYANAIRNSGIQSNRDSAQQVASAAAGLRTIPFGSTTPKPAGTQPPSNPPSGRPSRDLSPTPNPRTSRDQPRHLTAFEGSGSLPSTGPLTMEPRSIFDSAMPPSSDESSPIDPRPSNRLPTPPLTGSGHSAIGHTRNASGGASLATPQSGRPRNSLGSIPGTHPMSSDSVTDLAGSLVGGLGSGSGYAPQQRSSRGPEGPKVLFLAASLFEFNIDRERKEGGYSYLTYVPGEIFDIIGVKGELWLSRNQDDPNGTLGWIWTKHFAKLSE